MEGAAGPLAGQVANDESLYRSARKDDIVSADGKERISSSAFKDKGRKPSVDRACLRASPEETKLSPTDGIIELIASEVRGITDIQINPQVDPPGFYDIDVVHRPIEADETTGRPANHAHAQIEAAPHPDTDSRFKKVKEKLAFLANRRGWLIRPQ